MLVLTRKPGESIRIGDNIEIVIRRVSGNRVAIAIEAPREVSILRGELERFEETENGSAAKASDRNEAKPAARHSVDDSHRQREPYFIVQGKVSNPAAHGSIVPTPGPTVS